MSLNIKRKKEKVMVYVTRRFEFSAAHRYWRDDWSAAENERVFGKCTSRYGHASSPRASSAGWRT